MKKQSGNALFMILIAIFLLGAVTALISRTSGTTEETGDTEKGTIAASKLMRTASALEAGYQQLLLNGCSENQISFWQDINDDGAETAADGTFNPNSPTDHTCHMFHPNGVGLKSITKTLDVFVPAVMVDIGTPARDIYFGVQFESDTADRGLSKETCDAVNKIARNGFDIDSLPEASMTNTGFTGDFSVGQTIGDDGAETAMAGVKTGCVIDNGCGSLGTCRTFYHVIVKR